MCSEFTSNKSRLSLNEKEKIGEIISSQKYKKRFLDDDSEEWEDEEECRAWYAADGADYDLGNGGGTDRGEVEVRYDEEDDDSTDCVDEEFQSVSEEEEEERRNCDDDHKSCSDHT